ncbi:MAG: NADP-dependent isocitrate dehydrogenase, partial [Cyanobacteria bacterium P01_D01_bin.56]
WFDLQCRDNNFVPFLTSRFLSGIPISLNKANSQYLQNSKAPSRKVHELDNRGSHFYLALYWAQALAEQNKNTDLTAKFSKLAQYLTEHEGKIVAELNAVQGKSIDIGGYYLPDVDKTSQAMRPSETLNAALALV